MNLSEYRLADLSHLVPFKEKMGEEKYFKYAISVYKQLARLSACYRQFPDFSPVCENSRLNLASHWCLMKWLLDSD